MTKSTLITTFKNIVGSKNIATSEADTAYYRTGYRYGHGGALAVVFPNTLLEQWHVLQACVEAKCAIIMQASKTGLTGGSSPSGFDYDRDVVIINTGKIKKITLLDGGKQVLVLPGTTLFELSEALKKINRVPHSVLGSTTIGATVIGGIANNAGGALCKRGSSYTELSLFARVNEEGKLELVNHLGINNLGETPEEIFASLEAGNISPEDLASWDKAASDRDYANRIRDIDADVPNRYNADPKRLYDVSGSAGKVAAFAVRVDTYPVPEKKQVFVLGANDPNHFVTMRRHVLSNFNDLPEMCEYLDRATFDTAAKYGKDVYLSIKYLGTERLPKLYAFKAKVEYLLNKIPFLPKYIPDMILYYASQFFPPHLPKRLREYQAKYQHYLILSMTDEGIDEARQYLADEWSKTNDVGYFECTEEEQEAALLHRFSAAGAGLRYQNMHQGSTEEMLALDIARLSNDPDWIEELPEDISKDLDIALYYGHYMCHVFHNTYIFKKGTDVAAMKTKLLAMLESKGAKYPAEHNVGHMYEAEQVLKEFYAKLDPTNTFNPGIGKTDKRRPVMFT